MRKTFFVAAILLALTFAINAQQPDKSKRPSPPGQAAVSLADGKKIAIDYSRPKINDPKSGQPRKIFGALVPYGEVWRTGANEATSFVTDADLMVGSAHVPAGHYTLYSLPGENGWKLIISRKTGQWGTPYPGDAEDLARVDMTVQRTPSTVDPFTISLDKTGAKSAVLKMAWENTQASVDITEH
ncbi:MAG TPA: DUF2911 domain-containing protein [Terriglobales bacterium]|nr:DUF2911 domain-containing protein [Terriglobales bacterium]